MLTIIFLSISTITDILYRKIYNFILIPTFLISLYSHQNNLSDFFLALLISSIVILILYKLNFFAGGDAKLLIILGATVGYPRLFYLFAIIFIIGGLQAVIHKNFLNSSLATKKHLPYALSIFLGYLLFICI